MSGNKTLRIGAYVLFAMAIAAAIAGVVLLFRGWFRLGLALAVAALFLAHWARNCYGDFNSDRHNNHWWR
jgi:membrane protein implicated in regulation of membrane protease activity